MDNTGKDKQIYFMEGLLALMSNNKKINIVFLLDSDKFYKNIQPHKHCLKQHRGKCILGTFTARY